MAFGRLLSARSSLPVRRPLADAVIWPRFGCLAHAFDLAKQPGDWSFCGHRKLIIGHCPGVQQMHIAGLAWSMENKVMAQAMPERALANILIIEDDPQQLWC